MKKPYLAPFYIIAATFIGLGDTLYLSYYKWLGLTPGCTIGGCETVLNHASSVPWGIVPLAYLGVIYYLGMLALAIALAAKPESKLVRKATLAYAVFGGVSSIYFELYQFFVIGAMCLYCGLSAVVMIVLSFLAFWHWRASTPVV
jgi:uncharacterized membrane protein